MKKAFSDAGFNVASTMVDANDLFERIDKHLELIEAEIEEYIDHEEYTKEEQMYDEGYVKALRWANLMISEVLFKSREV